MVRHEKALDFSGRNSRPGGMTFTPDSVKLPVVTELPICQNDLHDYRHLRACESCSCRPRALVAARIGSYTDHRHCTSCGASDLGTDGMDLGARASDGGLFAGSRVGCGFVAGSFFSCALGGCYARVDCCGSCQEEED